MKEGWMKNDEGWMKNDEGWGMNDEGWWFQAVEGFWWPTDKLMNRHLWMWITFVTEKRGPRSPYNCNNIITKLRKNKIWTVHREQYHPLAICNASLSVYHGD